jgi:preprotein translocase subunit SecA
MIRKHTLEYDDVMNKQRQEIYGFRNDILRDEHPEEIAVELLDTVCANAAEKYFKSRSEEGGWDPEGYRRWLMAHFPVTFAEGLFDQEYLDVPELEKMASEKIIQAFKEKLERENAKVVLQPRPDGTMPPKPAYEAVRNLMIRNIDRLWQEHLLTMDHLRTDVNLRSVGQRDPLMEFKHEAFATFDEFGRNLRADIAQGLFRFEIITHAHPSIQQLLAGLQLETNRSFASELEASKAAAPAKQPEDTDPQESEPMPEKLQPVVASPRVGRNDTCPCGSGKKYKKCCGLSKDEEE